jgi:hypothetical protein
MASKDKIMETRLANHGMTSKSRMYVTKAGSWTRDNIENKTYEDWVKTFTSTTCESRNRPSFGLQEMAHTLLLAEPRLQEGVDRGLYGVGIAKLLESISANKENLEQLDGASTCAKTSASIKAGVQATVLWLRDLYNKKIFRALLPVLFTQGEVLRHVSQQLAEWTSACGDTETFADNISRVNDQPHPEQLKEFVRDKKHPEKKLIGYFTDTLAGASVAPKNSKRVSTSSFANWDDDEEDADGEGGDAAATPREKKQKKRSSKNPEDDAADEQQSEEAVRKTPSRKRRKHSAEHRDEDPAGEEQGDDVAAKTPTSKHKKHRGEELEDEN